MTPRVVSVPVGAVLLGEEFASLAGAVGVAGEGEDFGVVHEPVDHGCGDDVVAEDLPQRPKGLLLVTISEARS